VIRGGTTSLPARIAARAASWRPLNSARSRILGWSVVLLAAGLAVSTLATRVVLEQAMNSRVNAELAHEIAEFRALEARLGADEPPEGGAPRASSAATRAPLIALLNARARQAVLEHDTVLFGLIGDRIVATSSNTSPAAIGGRPVLSAPWATTAVPVTGSTQLASGQARYTAVPVRLPGDPARGVFVAAVLTGPQQAAINRVLRWQLAVGAVALLLGLALAWLTAGRVLRPVRDTTELARRITDTDLSGRIPVSGRHEVGELAVTFNRMLDRLESAVAAQREFLADAGHELRTPITIIQGNLDTITPAGDDAETLAIAADELARMTRLVDELLLLASSERPDFLRVQPTDLATMTRSLVAKARGLDGRPWVLAGAAPGVAQLDPQRITQAVMQLAANAAAHTPAGTPVEIWSASEGATVEFAVADHGPGIRPADRDRIFRRFARLDPRRTSGTGLGLSIVAAISAAHGGQVRVTESAGGGATFRIVIPLRPTAEPAAPPSGRLTPDLSRKAPA
jgi:two-component system, OmpR family, sensor kinase